MYSMVCHCLDLSRVCNGRVQAALGVGKVKARAPVISLSLACATLCCQMSRSAITASDGH